MFLSIIVNNKNFYIVKLILILYENLKWEIDMKGFYFLFISLFSKLNLFIFSFIISVVK